MKNSTIFFITLLVLFYSSKCFCQNELFKVVAIKGDVTKKTLADNQWEKLKFGNNLFSGEKVKLLSDCYLGLVHKTGKTIELRKEAVYDINELNKNIESGNNENILNKFINYIIEQLNQNDRPDRSSIVEASVYRTIKSEMEVYMPRNTYVIDSIITFSWYRQDGALNYLFSLEDRYSRPIYEQKVNDTSLTLALNNFNMEKENCYYWRVKILSNSNVSSEKYCIYLLNEANYKKINDTLNVLLKQYSENTALNKFLLGSFYERNKLHLNALIAYEEAIKLAPDVDEYKKTYALLLNKLGLYEKARKIWMN